MKNYTKRIILALAAGLISSLLVSWLRGLFGAVTAAEAFSALCDGFFVTSVLLLGIGTLTFVKNDGAFDAAFFSVRKVFQLKWQRLGDWRQEYRDYQAQKKTSRASPRPALLAGGAYFVLTLAALTVYLILISH